MTLTTLAERVPPAKRWSFPIIQRTQKRPGERIITSTGCATEPKREGDL